MFLWEDEEIFFSFFLFKSFIMCWMLRDITISRGIIIFNPIYDVHFINVFFFLNLPNKATRKCFQTIGKNKKNRFSSIKSLYTGPVWSGQNVKITFMLISKRPVNVFFYLCCSMQSFVRSSRIDSKTYPLHTHIVF